MVLSILIGRMISKPGHWETKSIRVVHEGLDLFHGSFPSQMTSPRIECPKTIGDATSDGGCSTRNERKQSTFSSRA
jgi:hypothetical protein